MSRLNEDFYPGEKKLANERVGENWLPKSLLKFMEILVLSKKSIGKCGLLQTNSSEITPQKSDLRQRMKQPNFGSNVPKCIDVVKLFITAERVSDWRLHFFAVEKTYIMPEVHDCIYKSLPDTHS